MEALLEYIQEYDTVATCSQDHHLSAITASASASTSQIISSTAIAGRCRQQWRHGVSPWRLTRTQTNEETQKSLPVEHPAGSVSECQVGWRDRSCQAHLRRFGSLGCLRCLDSLSKKRVTQSEMPLIMIKNNQIDDVGLRRLCKAQWGAAAVSSPRKLQGSKMRYGHSELTHAHCWPAECDKKSSFVIGNGRALKNQG
jgi:hypothetical protein